MSVIVNDTGFGQDDWQGEIVDLASDTAPESLAESVNVAALVRIDFPSFADGRGFTLATRLRGLGFQGRLRARGHVIADQYAMARRAGFDDVEIPDDLAARQPEDQWLRRAGWQAHDYQSRLRRSA